MKIALALLLLPAAAHARAINFTCTLTERVGGPDYSSSGSMGWSPGSGFERPGGLILLAADGLKADVTVVRDTNHASGFFYHLHLFDESNGKAVDREFLDSLSLRPRVEGNVSIDCRIDA